jgi:putative multiple sugar transport system substrate-binding protein
MKSNRLLRAAISLAVVAGLAACGSAEKTGGGDQKETAAGPGSLVGITMPTRVSPRWIADGKNLSDALTGMGYKVDLQYAENDIPTQANQIENQITKGAKVLVIASIDGKSLSTQLQEAADKKIKVISYDRLLLNSPNVDYYASFDNYRVGVLQATSLLTGLGLKKADGSEGTAKGPFNIEVFAGSPDDNNSSYFFNGAMDTLKPYLDKGTVKILSGEQNFKTVAILRWDPATAQRRMEDLLTKSYGQATIQGVLSPYDGLSIGILSALKSNGYGTSGRPYPIVTGQDAETASVKSIIKGEQYSSVFKDTRDLAKRAAQMADAVLKGTTPEVNDTKAYNNGVKVVPSYLLTPVALTKDNYQKVLIDSGYYQASDLQ